MTEKQYVSSQEFADYLRTLTTETPLTNACDADTSVNQVKDCFWRAEAWKDPSKCSGTHKEHLICWFTRKAIEARLHEEYGIERTTEITTVCMKENYDNNGKGPCQHCWFAEQEWYGKVQEPVFLAFKAKSNRGKKAECVFNNMGRPEMYFWIAEAMELFDKEELKNYIDSIKPTMQDIKMQSKPINTLCTEIRQTISWDKVEEKYQQDILARQVVK